MDTNTNPPNQMSPRGETPKRFKLVMGIFILFVLAIGVTIIARAYERWHGISEIEKIARGLRQYEEEVYKAQKADTYGGKTPQETLQLYIDAVELGDYSLASKYFVIDKQGQELKSLTTAPKENTENVQRLLKEAINKVGSFNSNKTVFVLDEPIFVKFILYTNGIWKINEF